MLWSPGESEVSTGARPFDLPLGVDIERWLRGGKTGWDGYPDTRSGKMDAETCGLASALAHDNVELVPGAPGSDDDDGAFWGSLFPREPFPRVPSGFPPPLPRSARTSSVMRRSSSSISSSSDGSSDDDASSFPSSGSDAPLGA